MTKRLYTYKGFPQVNEDGAKAYTVDDPRDFIGWKITAVLGHDIITELTNIVVCIVVRKGVKEYWVTNLGIIPATILNAKTKRWDNV